MKDRHVTKNLDEALDIFIKELPDPATPHVSTIIDQFEIDGQMIILYAQKYKSDGGMKWKVSDMN